MANQLDAAQIPKLVKLLQQHDSCCAGGAPAVWRAGPKAAPALSAARAALQDESPDVRIAAAECWQILATMTRHCWSCGGLKQDNEFVRLAALNVLGRMGRHALPAWTTSASPVPRRENETKPRCDSVQRMVNYLPEQIAK